MLYHLSQSAWLYLAPVALGVLRSFFNQHLRRPLRRLLPSLDTFVTVDVAAKPEDHSYSYYGGLEGSAKSSDAYGEVLAYLSDACSREARQLRAEGAAEGHGLVLSLREGQEVADEFKGVTLWWSAVPHLETMRTAAAPIGGAAAWLVVDEYLPYVRRTGQELATRNRPRRLYSNKKELNYHSRRDEVWSYIDFDHPTTFETLAMDPAKKQMIMDDLDDFRNSKDYYRRVGKAWKRGYLLHGPPGTGKTTMIAAMANYLNYDIYDVELTSLETNSDLRKLFIETTGKSIIVIEDIDCSLDLTGSRAAMMPQRDVQNAHRKDEKNIVTLSGLLNFIDGLWSANGSSFGAFVTLAKNYLGVDAHPLFYDVEELLQVADMTPADVAECLMMPPERTARRDVDACLARLVDELKKKREEKKSVEEKRAANEKVTPE
ncbi:unnamed protein product [Alopecurus aequalis]